MTKLDKLRTRIRNSRKTGLRYQTDIIAVIEKRKQTLHLLRLRMLIKFVKIKFLNMTLQTRHRQITPGSACGLHYISVNLRQQRQYPVRYYLPRIILPERRRY